ncbi:hypothetical protein CRE_18396 [Caenorhabditis remanei]|uniref:16S rRNA (uracil(1498)-N(3))-methyltransferase n=1 Tax=Caenorhabditis remanei TaxID=31234 RepID=E3NWX3_CAERE|nr:hypothetical protein CRE_18396 [Caenorhabditis remanei]
MVSERSLAVLHALVGDYVESNEPVGSKSIVERHSFGVSAATIRNDMALLEDEELIAAPHTSSGRVPTDKGYRLYVDTLSRFQPLSAGQRAAIERFLGESSDLDDAMARTVRLLAQLTNQVAVVQYPSLKRTAVRHIDLVAVGEARVLCVLILGTGVVEQQVAALPAVRVTEAWVHGLRERIAGAVIGSDLERAVQAVELLDRTVGDWAEPAEAELVRSVLSLNEVRTEPEATPRVTLVQALAKGDRDERAVEQATEFGVDRVVPWQAARSVSRWDGAGGAEKAAKGVAKWARIAREASKQSLRARVPEVGAPISSGELRAAASDPDRAVIALHPRGERTLSDWAAGFAAGTSRPAEILLVVGPEGGFSDAELDALESAGAEILVLGTTVLRTSSAGPAGLAVLNVALGRW